MVSFWAARSIAQKRKVKRGYFFRYGRISRINATTGYVVSRSVTSAYAGPTLIDVRWWSEKWMQQLIYMIKYEMELPAKEINGERSDDKTVQRR